MAPRQTSLWQIEVKYETRATQPGQLSHQLSQGGGINVLIFQYSHLRVLENNIGILFKQYELQIVNERYL